MQNLDQAGLFFTSFSKSIHVSHVSFSFIVLSEKLIMFLRFFLHILNKLLFNFKAVISAACCLMNALRLSHTQLYFEKRSRNHYGLYLPFSSKWASMLTSLIVFWSRKEEEYTTMRVCRNSYQVNFSFISTTVLIFLLVA